MYELNQVGERTYYINCPAKIGIFKLNDTDVCLIDSGNDKDAGKKVRKILDENGWKLKCIVNTHSHADHIGANRYLQQQTSCKIFASGIEASFTEHTILEPAFLYGGYPCKDLKHKFLFAAESEVLDFSDESFPKELQVIDLGGHFFDMKGIRTSDCVVFLADCLSSKATLEKYRIPFIYDIQRYLDTLDKVENMNAEIFVPSHAEVTNGIKDLVSFNKSNVHQTADKIIQLLEKPKCFEELLKELFDCYELTMNFEQYVLVGSTVRSYLSWLKDNGKITVEFSENRLLWKVN